MDKTKVLHSIDEIKALSDPYRLKILNCFYEVKEPLTVKQIADRLGEVPANIHYHVKKLLQYGIVVLHHTEVVKGIIAKYYTPTAESFEIECEKEVDQAAKTLMLSETQRMIASIYDESKAVFLKQFNDNILLEKVDKRKGNICSEEIFLEEKDAIEVFKYINDFIKCHKNSDDLAGKKKYQCFFSLINIK